MEAQYILSFNLKWNRGKKVLIYDLSWFTFIELDPLKFGQSCTQLISPTKAWKFDAQHSPWVMMETIEADRERSERCTAKCDGGKARPSELIELSRQETAFSKVESYHGITKDSRHATSYTNCNPWGPEFRYISWYLVLIKHDQEQMKWRIKPKYINMTDRQLWK